METLRNCIMNGRLTGYATRQFNDPIVRELRLKTNEAHNLHMPEKQLSPDQLFAHYLKIWCTHGFPTLGDDCGRGCDGMTLQVTTRVGYVKNPIGTAQNISNSR